MSNQYVDHALNVIRPFFEEVQGRLDKMKVGDKVPAVALAAEIAAKYGMTGPQLYSTLKFFFDNCPELEVRRGAHGGLFKIVPKTAAAVVATVEPTVIAEPQVPATDQNNNQ